MKDKDFDDIRKRLYDLEAEPPKEGWKKIGVALNTTPQKGKVVWLRKNWWKPLILLIPLSALIVYSFRPGNDSKVSGPGKNDLIGEEQTQKSPESGRNDDAVTAESEEAIQPRKPKENSTDYQAANGLSRHQETTDQQSSLRNNTAIHPVPENNPNEQQKTELSFRTLDERSTTESIHPSPAHTPTDIESPTDELPVDNQKEQIGYPEIVDDQSKVSDKRQLTVVTDSTRSVVVSNHVTDIPSDEPASGKRLHESDTTLSKDEDKLLEKNENHNWRITVSFTPQYLTGPARPRSNDDVLITKISDSRNSRKVGLGFAIGAGKAITPNFYIDGQLSYIEAGKDINFSYATGKIDTLIAVQQPDERVLVTPVYEVAVREISSKYSYGGIRLGGTYYFWSTSRRRFNIAASLGTHYLLSADVKERRNGNWVSLDNENLNKTNFTLTVGAGYNIILNRGWELMINPTLTHFMRKVKEQDLPYDLDQRSLGINLMLSKHLGRK